MPLQENNQLLGCQKKQKNTSLRHTTSLLIIFLQHMYAYFNSVFLSVLFFVYSTCKTYVCVSWSHDDYNKNGFRGI